MADRLFFPTMLVVLIALIVFDAVAGNYSALSSDVLAAALLSGWYFEARLRGLANKSIDDITAQLRDINQEIGRG